MAWRAAVAAAALAAVAPQLAIAAGWGIGTPSPPAATAEPRRPTSGISPSGSASPGPPALHFDPKLQWPLASFGAAILWRRTEGAGVKIAVIDTGIDTAQPDLAGAVTEAVNLAGGTGSDSSSDSHGTVIAGLIAGRDRLRVAGLAPRASLIDIRVATQARHVHPAEIANGIKAAVEAGAEIINVSLGTSVDDPGLRRAVKGAEDRGILVVASAGDSELQYPAGYPGVLSVGAVDRMSALMPRSGSGGGAPVSIYAPGVDLFSTRVFVKVVAP